LALLLFRVLFLFFEYLLGSITLSRLGLPAKRKIESQIEVISKRFF